jgi:hypothetical protein
MTAIVSEIGECGEASSTLDEGQQGLGSLPVGSVRSQRNSDLIIGHSK